MKNLPIISHRIFLLLAIVFTGCSSVPATPSTAQNPNATYKYDLQVTVGNTVINGIGVVPVPAEGDAGLGTETESYQMKITSRVDVDLLAITSCHRDFSAESAISLNWFVKKRSYSYTYNPAAGIEDVGSCLLRVGSYNQAKGANAWAIVDFETPESTLPSKNYCNGTEVDTRGVSVCQSRAGLTQILKFPVPVKQAVTSLDPKCAIAPPADGVTWSYSIAQGECVMAFMESDKPHRIHRHTTVGYSDILIRGE